MQSIIRSVLLANVAVPNAACEVWGIDISCEFVSRELQETDGSVSDLLWVETVESHIEGVVHSRQKLIVEIAELFLIDRFACICVGLDTAKLWLEVGIFKDCDELVPVSFVGLEFREGNCLIVLWLDEKHNAWWDSKSDNEDSGCEEKVYEKPISFLFDPFDTLIEGVQHWQVHTWWCQ